MKILYIACSCDPYNGSEDQIGWSVPWECAKEDEVFVITRTDLEPSITRFLSQHKQRNITFYYVGIPLFCQKIFKGSFFSGRLLVWNNIVFSLAKKICEEQDIQIIHQITPIEFRAVGKYGSIPNIKFVCGPLGAGQNIPAELMSYVSWKGKVVEKIRSFINCFYKFKMTIDKRLRNSDYVLFANRETLDFLYNDKFRSEKCICYDNGVSEDEVNNYEDKKLNVSKEKKSPMTFLVAGRLIYIKGHDFLFDALETLPDSYEYQCRVVGDGPLYQHLYERSQAPKLKGKVQVLGKIPYERMKEEYKKADALIFCSLRETSGTVILEAMEYAIPVITINKFGGAIILNSNNSWVYDGKSKEEYLTRLREIIKECIANPAEVRARGQQGHEDVKQLTWECKIKQYREIYQKILMQE